METSIASKVYQDFKDNLIERYVRLPKEVININPSRMGSLCIRRIVMHRHLNVPEFPDPVPIGLAFTFSLGSSIEDIFFKNCESILYQETNASIKLKKYGFTFSGKIDCFNLINDVYYINEVKSIKVKSEDEKGTDHFDGLTEPLINHWLQIQTYLWMINQRKVKLDTIVATKDRINKDIGLVTYLAKGYKSNPIKVFEVERSKPFAKQMKDIVSSLRKYSISGSLPERVCTTRHHPLAKQCQLVNDCFKLIGEEE